jgi:hypothetical protein
LARKWGVSGPLIETLRNASTASSGDLDLALLEIHNRVAQKIAAGRPLTSYLRRSLGNEAVLRQNLAFIDAHLDLLKRTISNQLTPEEVPVVMAKLPQLQQVATLLLDGETLDVDIATVLRDAIDFYPFAFLRDESLVTNSLAALDQDATHPSTGILIVGGFHAGAISDYLQNHKIPYMMINPTITRDVTAQEQFNYIKRMCDEHVTAEELAEDYSHPTRLDTAQKGAVENSISATISPTEVDPKDPNTHGMLDALAPTAEALLAAVPGAQVSAVEAVNPTVAATLDVKGGQLVAREDSKTSNISVALSRLLSPILQQSGATTANTKTVEIVGVDGNIFNEIKFKNDKQAVRWDRGPAVVEGVGTEHVKITINNDWLKTLDLESLGVLFSAMKGSNLPEAFNAEQKAAAQAVYALAHEITHAIAGENEKAPVISLAAAIGLVAVNAGIADAATGVSNTAVQIPTAFAQRFAEATSEVLPDANIAAAIGASQAGTVTVKGLAETISNAIEPVVLGDVAVQKLADALQQQVGSQVSREEAMLVLQAHLKDPSFALTGQISPAKWQKMVEELLQRVRNAQFGLAA